MTQPIITEHVLTRRDTAANWALANPILLSGEEAVETDTLRRKIGDGATAWTALPYVTALPADVTAAQAAAVAAAATDATAKAGAAQAAAIAATSGQVTDASVAAAWGSSTGAKAAAAPELRVAFDAEIAAQNLATQQQAAGVAAGMALVFGG